MNKYNIWQCKQTPSEKVDEYDIIDIIRNNKIITCPNGHNIKCVKNLLKGISNDKELTQDLKFLNDIKLNDYCIIPYKKSHHILIVKITSKAYVRNITNLIQICDNVDKVLNICSINKINDYIYHDCNIEIVRSYIRDIEIIADISCEYKYRKFGQTSFNKIIDKNIIDWVTNIITETIKININKKKELKKIIPKTIVEKFLDQHNKEVPSERKRILMKLKNPELYEICHTKGIICPKKTKKNDMIGLLLQYELENKEEEILTQLPKKKNSMKNTNEE
tara:strand:+ start:253 stop:1086 length:834 start_codon:yes stop_codon:yes gene_type:complete